MKITVGFGERVNVHDYDPAAASALEDIDNQRVELRALLNDLDKQEKEIVEDFRSRFNNSRARPSDIQLYTAIEYIERLGRWSAWVHVDPVVGDKAAGHADHVGYFDTDVLAQYAADSHYKQLEKLVNLLRG